jgi:ubiquinone/menaquinone biosynthesis C-methylase UbiE
MVNEINPFDDALQYNSKVYADYYRNPLLKLRYDLLYRANRIAWLLHASGVVLSAPGFRVFEYGFGAGHLLHAVASASAVVGMESSPSAVARATAEKPQSHPGWHISQWSDATSIPLESESFDLVTASHVLEHLPDDQAAIMEWTRLIRPGGFLLIILPSNEVLFKGSKHLRTYDIRDFSGRLEGLGLEKIVVDEHQRFDRFLKHRYLVLAARKSVIAKILIGVPKVMFFLPAQLLSWKILAGLDATLNALGVKSSSIVYLYRKPLKGCEMLT